MRYTMYFTAADCTRAALADVGAQSHTQVDPVHSTADREQKVACLAAQARLLYVQHKACTGMLPHAHVAAQ